MGLRILSRYQNKMADNNASKIMRGIAIFLFFALAYFMAAKYGTYNGQFPEHKEQTYKVLLINGDTLEMTEARYQSMKVSKKK